MKSLIDKVCAHYLISRALMAQDLKDGVARERYLKQRFVPLAMFILTYPIILFNFAFKKVRVLWAGIRAGRNNRAAFEKYKGKVLGSRSCKAEKLTVKDLVPFSHFVSNVLGDLESREVDLYKDGWDFLEEYYGFNKLAHMMHADDDHFPTDSIEGNLEFLRGQRALVSKDL